MSAREVSTSTIGVGHEYNENLLGAMARAGAGNYYYVESSVQLRDVFQTELQGLMGTTGRNAELTVRLAPGVTVVEVLNELERGPNGEIKLPDLVSDMPIAVMVRLSVSPRSTTSDKTSELVRFQLAWDPTGETETAHGRLEAKVGLALPSIREAD